jgi:hypothetical protein
MNARICAFAGSVVLVLLAVGSVRAQKKMAPDEMIAAIKPGQWVKVEGTSIGDSSVMCEEVQLLIGNFLDDDWSIIGLVRTIDQENRKLEILRLPIKVDDDAEFEHKGKDHGFDMADLKTGMFLEIGGTYLKDGTFLANEVEDKSTRLAKGPELKKEIKVEGEVEKVDPVKHRFILMGITFQITEGTRNRSVIQ